MRFSHWFLAGAFLALACLQPVAPDHVSFVQDATVKVQTPDVLGQQGLCAGVWISADRVLTAAHCTSQSELEITDRIGGSSTAFLLAKDEASDLALIKVNSPPEIHPAVSIAKSVPKTGAHVKTVGHTDGLPWTYSEGIVSAYRATSDLPSTPGTTFNPTGPWLQVAAPFWFGNSGGGCFDDDDNLVGIASFKLDAPGFGFFVSNETIRSFLRGK